MEMLKGGVVYYENQKQLSGDRHSKAIQTLSPTVYMVHVFFLGFPIPNRTAVSAEAL